jgi:molybdenum cofactor biosynthesis enzyme
MQIYGVDLELWIAVLAAVLGLTVWGLKKYQTIMADGKVSLDEIIDTLTESESKIDDVVDAVEDLTAAMDAKKKAELVEMCKEKGLPTSGTKADLISRLSEAVEANTEEE